MNRVKWLAVVMGIACAGCGTAPGTPDAGSDAPTTITPDTGREVDAFRAPDAFAPVDGGSDAFVQPDALVPDAFAAPDAYVPLPAITDDTPHAAPASAAGHDRYYGVALGADSSFYVCGITSDGTAATDDFRTVVAHFGANGELDTTFGTAGFFVQNLSVGTNAELARGIAVQSDGRIVVSALVDHVGGDPRDRDIAVIRLTTAGVLDTTFGVSGIRLMDLSTGEVDGTGFSTVDTPWGLALDSADRIVVPASRKRDGALDSDFALFRLTADGAVDATFGTAGVYSFDLGMVNNNARNVNVLDDGTIIGAGYYTPTGGVMQPVLYKVDATGAPVVAFGTNGVYTEVVLDVQTEAYGAAIQGEYVMTAGYGRNDGPGDNDYVSLRIHATTGVRDLTYGNSGAEGYMLLPGFDFGDNARVGFVLPDDRFVMLGQLRADAMNQDAAIVVLTRDGMPDTTFGANGVETVDFGGIGDHFWAGAVDPRGERIVIVGIATSLTAPDDGAVWLFEIP